MNVLLFIPFGLGLSAKLYQRNWSWTGSVVAAAATGAIFSYAIESIQIYVPMRNSGWEDIFSNTTGSVLGALVFAGIGRFIVRLLSRGEEHLESWLSQRWTWALLPAYLAAWIAVWSPYSNRPASRIGNRILTFLLGPMVRPRVLGRGKSSGYKSGIMQSPTASFKK